MCGRYTLRAKPAAVAEEFDLPEVPSFTPRFNVAPTQSVAVVRFDPEEDARRLDALRWGLVPFWADDPGIGNRMINARADTVATKPAFRHAFKSKRCLIVADGFYEWQKRDGGKQPYFIHMRDDCPFAFAGLWDLWTKGDEPLSTCTIITTNANDLMTTIHERMPVIIPRSAYEVWLDPDVKDAKRLEPLLMPYPDDQMEAYPVSSRVNNPTNDVPECVVPLRSSR
jgi:putative SOS response-associated peptidase YedK